MDPETQPAPGVEGLPQRALEALAAAAREAGDADASADSGRPLLGLDMPRYLPFLPANNRSLRERGYRAHVGRASEGELDNRALIEEILTLRRKKRPAAMPIGLTSASTRWPMFRR